jgi:HEAT repeat protein
MTATDQEPTNRLRRQFTDPNASTRLQTALAAGTSPNPQYVDVLVERSGIEPDFFVRDMLTWALTRHPVALTLPRLLDELGRAHPQARSQALHTLSKIGAPAAWPAITAELLRDADDEVARSAWRAAVVLVPTGSEVDVARQLTAQLGRGGRDLQLSLSRALAALGEAARPAVARAATADEETVRLHALATQRLLDDPNMAFEAALHDARRISALAGAPVSGGTDADR